MNLPPSTRLTASLLACLTLLLCSCTTVANRRDLYFLQTIWGPYTKMLHHGIPKTTGEQGTITTKSSGGKDVIRPQR